MSIPDDDRNSAVAHIAESVDGYASAATRTAYRSDLSLWAAHCHRHGDDLFEVRRADIEGYARHLEGWTPPKPKAATRTRWRAC